MLGWQVGLWLLGWFGRGLVEGGRGVLLVPVVCLKQQPVGMDLWVAIPCFGHCRPDGKCSSEGGGLVGG